MPARTDKTKSKAAPPALKTYAEKRDFARTPEPKAVAEGGQHHEFVMQMHAARRLHYDLRLELDRDTPWAERAKRALKYCEIQMANVEAVSEAGRKDLSVKNV